MEILIPSKKIDEAAKFLKLFLKQKAAQEEEIRSFNANETDLYKDLLLEEYLSGVLIVLRACNIDFSIDDKLSDLEFLSQGKDVVCQPEEGIKEIYITHRKEVISLLNKIVSCSNTFELIELEKILHGIYYSFLGSTTIINKFGLRASITNFFGDEKHFLSYVDGREISDYKQVSVEMNEIIDFMYEKYNILKIQSITEWRKNISLNQSKLLRGMNEVRKVNNQEDDEELVKNGASREAELNKTFIEIDDMLVDIGEELIIREAKHQTALIEFAKRYFRYDINDKNN